MLCFHIFKPLSNNLSVLDTNKILDDVRFFKILNIIVKFMVVLQLQL